MALYHINSVVTHGIPACLDFILFFFSANSKVQFQQPYTLTDMSSMFFFYLFTNRYICFTYDLEQSGRIGFLYGNFHYVKVAIKKRVNMYCIAYDLVQICIGNTPLNMIVLLILFIIGTLTVFTYMSHIYKYIYIHTYISLYTYIICRLPPFH